MATLISGVEPFEHYGRRHCEEHFREIILNLYQWFRRRCRIKIYILILCYGGHLVWRSKTVLAILAGRGHNEEHFREIILNFD